MHWLTELFKVESVARDVLILGLVVALGLTIGSLRLRGLGLGIAGVLFAGLALGQAGCKVSQPVLEFAREFGLILFVYTIGMQVGPGFLASLRRQGLPLNLMAGGIVLIGAGIAVIIYLLAGVPLEAAVGLFCGATTNTPSLGAAQEAIRNVHGPGSEMSTTPGLAYAVAYPFGILGIILTMYLVRFIFRIQLGQEEQALRRQLPAEQPAPAVANLEVRNPNLVGMALKDIPLLGESGLVVSRIFQPAHGKPAVPQPETRLDLADTLLVVGPKAKIAQLRVVVGGDSALDLRALPSDITTQRLIVTQKAALGHSLEELDFVRRFGVTITRVSRAEIEMTPTPGFEIQYGDTVLAVGEPAAIRNVAAELGNSPKALNYPHLVPIFVGIVLGVILGSWPIAIPGVPAPVKLGLAGGPLLVAIVLSRIGSLGPLVWYMPISANFMLREMGIVLFLACVGLRAGDQFLPTLLQGPGLYWMGLAALITLLPLLIVALIARVVLKLNFLLLCGLLAGSMTDPPALSFANNVTGSDAPNIAYATVYPLTMILRVLCAQLMVIVLLH